MEHHRGESWLIEGQCWICGDVADSAEHFVKASDLRFNWPRKPFAMTRKDGPPMKIQGPKSDKLKYRPSLCKNCNNNRTQRADSAWEEFNDRLQPIAARKLSGGSAHLPKLFSNSRWRDVMLGVHLYWAKALGCYLAECNQRGRAGELREALLHDTPCPTLQLVFFAVPVGDGHLLHKTTLHTWSPINAAFFLYSLNSIAVASILSPTPKPRYKQLEHWHPISSEKTIRLHELGAGDWHAAAERNAMRRARERAEPDATASRTALPSGGQTS